MRLSIPAILSLGCLLAACERYEISIVPSPTPPPPDASYSGSYPRFPHDTEARRLRDVTVFYSPDDLNSAVTWESLGYPDKGLFRLHHAFPKLKYTLQIVVENAWLGPIPGRNIMDDPVAASVWKELATREEFKSWVELGNHGYHHAPEGDANTAHGEFDIAANPKAGDSAFCYGTFAKARRAYASLGLDNDRINVMRFPGYHKTTMALQALADGDFLAFYDRIHSGREAWIPLERGRELLSIPDVGVTEFFDYPPLVEGLRNGEIDAKLFRSSQAYTEALDTAYSRMQVLAANGGVINLFDHWWEHAYHDVQGVSYRFHLFQDLLERLDRDYGARIWWGFGSELARWAHLQRHGRVVVSKTADGVEVDFSLPGQWKPAWAMEAGYTLKRTTGGDFPPIARITCTRIEADRTVVYLLDPGKYWVSGDNLHFNVLLSGDTQVRVEFGSAP